MDEKTAINRSLPENRADHRGGSQRELVERVALKEPDYLAGYLTGTLRVTKSEGGGNRDTFAMTFTCDYNLDRWNISGNARLDVLDQRGRVIKSSEDKDFRLDCQGQNFTIWADSGPMDNIYTDAHSLRLVVNSWHPNHRC